MKVYARRGWEPEAKQWIATHASTMTLQALVEQFNSTALERGWTPRAYQAIRQQVRRTPGACTKRHNTPWEPEQLQWLVDNRRHQSIAQLTKGYNVVAAQRGWPSRTEYAISQQLSKRVKVVVRLTRPVINLDTGATYRSAAEAAVYARLDAQALRSAIKHGKPIEGHRWAYVDELEARG